MRIGVDLDGVLVNFNAGFMDLQVAVAGRDLFGQPRPAITCWNYPVDQFGYTKDEFNRAWRAVEASDRFWRKLGHYDGALDVLTRLEQLALDGHEIYFITSRAGQAVKSQTETWLHARGYEWPTVLISSAKGLCAEALKLDLYIDDKVENCQQVVAARHECHLLMLAQPWNQQLQGVPRISLADFRAMLEAL